MAFPPHLAYLKDTSTMWFNPCWGYHGFWKRLSEFRQEKNLDFQTAWSQRDMKKNKEMYATALAALCVQQDAPSEYGWWFTKPSQDPPDGVIATPVRDTELDANIMRVREVEVVEYLGGSLLDTIQQKLKGKSYEPNTILVCLLSPQGSNQLTVFNFESLAEQIKQAALPLAHVFLAGHGFQIPLDFEKMSREQQFEEMYKIMLVQLLPKYAMTNISPLHCCKNFREGKEQAWLKFMGLGKGTGFQKVAVDTAPKLFN